MGGAGNGDEGEKGVDAELRHLWPEKENPFHSLHLVSKTKD